MSDVEYYEMCCQEQRRLDGLLVVAERVRDLKKGQPMTLGERQDQVVVEAAMTVGSPLWRGLQDHWTALNKRRSELAVERLGQMQQGIVAAGGGLIGGGPVITPTQDSMDSPTPADKQSMDHMADQVIKGVLDGSVTRGKVRQIANAADTRQKNDDRSDAVGRAIRFGGVR